MYKLLIVDDEPHIRSGLKHIIEWEIYGIEIIGAVEDGTKAYSLIQSGHPDLVLLDITMPTMNGLELIELCSRLESVPKFIILTGYNDFKYVQRALQLGAVDYLLKPIDQNELENAVSSCIKLLDNLRVRRQIFNESLPALQNDMLLRILNNQIDILEFQKKSAAIDIVLKNGSMYAGIFTIFSDKNRDPSSLLHSMDLCQKTLSTFCSCYVISSNGQDLAVIFQNKTQCPETNFQDLMTSCSQVLADKLGRPVFYALGREVFHIRDLHLSYSDCLAKIEKKPAEKPLKTFAEAEYPLLVQKVLKMARENYTDSNLSLKTLAASMQVNPAYLGREFTIATGEYFNDYINGIRISEAIRLLGTTSLKASKIAESVGFTNASYFFTVFKKITGQSPNDYRCSRHKNML